MCSLSASTLGARSKANPNPERKRRKGMAVTSPEGPSRSQITINRRQGQVKDETQALSVAFAKPVHFSTGSRGYLGKDGSLRESSHSQNTEAREDSTRLA